MADPPSTPLTARLAQWVKVGVRCEMEERGFVQHMRHGLFYICLLVGGKNVHEKARMHGQAKQSYAWQEQC